VRPLGTELVLVPIRRISWHGVMHVGNGSSFAPFCVRSQRYPRNEVGAVVSDNENIFEEREVSKENLE